MFLLRPATVTHWRIAIGFVLILVAVISSGCASVASQESQPPDLLKTQCQTTGGSWVRNTCIVDF